jgi:glycosyltransferase involved in cell wall biosynthesis
MKILHVIPSVSTVRGGTTEAVIQMVRALRCQGIDVEIATTNDSGDELLDVELYNLIEHQQVPVRFFPRFSPNIKSIREFAFSSAFTTWMWKNISKYQLLHIHAIFSYTSTVTMAIARHYRVPYIVITHGQLCAWSLAQSARKKQIYLSLIERTNLNHSKALHFTADFEQQEVSQLNIIAPNFVLPLGLSPPTIIPDARQKLRRQLNRPLDEPIFLFLSRIHEKKGLEYLIPALGKLTNQQFTFILAGSGSPEYQLRVEQMLSQHGILDRTYLAGFATGENKNILLQGSDLFVLTSHSENFGISVLEALASGLPVLVTPGVALSSIVRDCKLGYVANLDVSAITQTLQQHLDTLSNGTKGESDQHIRQFVQSTYSWDKIAGDLINIYKNILSQAQIP